MHESCERGRFSDSSLSLDRILVPQILDKFQAGLPLKYKARLAGGILWIPTLERDLFCLTPGRCSRAARLIVPYHQLLIHTLGFQGPIQLHIILTIYDLVSFPCFFAYCLISSIRLFAWHPEHRHEVD